MDNNIFYVYAHLKKTDGKCFYIGKGQNKRAWVKHNRNRYWHNTVNKHGYDVIILINNISEQKAFELESNICQQIGYENLTNLRHELGDGGWSHSKETKDKIRKANIGNTYKLGYKCTEEQKRKIGESKKGKKSRLGKKLTIESRLKLSNSRKGQKRSIISIQKQILSRNKAVICLTDNKEHDSIKLAAKYYNISMEIIRQNCSGLRSTAKNLNFKFK